MVESEPRIPRTEGVAPRVIYPQATQEQWQHGRTEEPRPVWVRLDALCVRRPGTKVRTNGAGVVMTGEIQGS